MRFLKLLFLAFVLMAAGLRAEVADYYEGSTSGAEFPHLTGTAYTNWGNLTATVASSPLEMSGYTGMYLHVSSTAAGAPKLNVQFNETSYTATAWVTLYQMGANSYGFIRKQAPWVRVVAVNASTATSPTTTYSFARYALVTATAGAITGSVTSTISGAVGLTPATGAPGSPISVRNGGYFLLSVTAFSNASLTTNSLSLTYMAGISDSSPGLLDINCWGMTGMNFIVTQSSTAPAGFPSNLMDYQPCIQISQIPRPVNFTSGSFIHYAAIGLSATGGSGTIQSLSRTAN